MNDDIIKSAEEYSNDIPTQNGFLAGAEYMQAKKDEHIKELVEALEHSNMVIKSWNDIHSQIFKNNELIQKHKR